MFKLAHFSDPHIGPLPRPSMRELLSKRITGYLNYKRNRSRALTGDVLGTLLSDLKKQAPDHIALTGDIVNIALDAEILAARQWLESVGQPRDISLIPGNHDAYVRGSLNKAKGAWSPFWLGDDARDEVEFPYLRRRGPIAIIALSTGVATAPFMATGTLGRQQIEKAGQLLRQTASPDIYRAVLIHHPPFVEKGRWMKRLTDHRAFVKMIEKEGGELVLHGHTHRRNVTSLKGPKGSIPVVGVPSASSGLNGKHEPSRYNLFNIEKQNEQWKCLHIERGVTPKGTFEELSRKVL
ncbi:MAG: metallophosphoesterase [Hyphomicrobiales bacterium]